MVRGRLLRTAVAVASLAVIPPAGAAAQEPGVTIDPNSPSGRQYAIPLDDARSTGSGGSDAGSRGGAKPSGQAAGDEPRLFGDGIDDRSGSSDARGTTTTRRATSGGDRREGRRTTTTARTTTTEGGASSRGGTTPTADGRPRRPTSEASAAPGDDGGSTAVPLLLAVALVAAATGAGLVWRRRAGGRA